MIRVKDVYNYLNREIPFDTQEKWDNSGYLVKHDKSEYLVNHDDSGYLSGHGDSNFLVRSGRVRKVLLSLDISKETVSEAINRANHESYKWNDILIISHHPVIFSPLKYIDTDSVVGMLLRNSIPAICMHTNVDKCARGTNWVILRKMHENFKAMHDTEELEDGFGYIITLEEPEKITDIAEKVKKIFGCEYVRGSRCISEYPEKTAKRIAFCSGSGGSMFEEVLARKCDLYITGDIKHDVWIYSNNEEVTILDCGHFHTENPRRAAICKRVCGGHEIGAYPR